MTGNRAGRRVRWCQNQQRSTMQRNDGYWHRSKGPLLAQSATLRGFRTKSAYGPAVEGRATALRSSRALNGRISDVFVFCPQVSASGLRPRAGREAPAGQINRAGETFNGQQCEGWCSPQSGHCFGLRSRRRLTQCMVRPCVARGVRRVGGERSCINVSGLCLEPVGLPAIMDISAPAISLADRPHRAIWVTSARMRREDRASISSHLLEDLGR
jgi:hypothetical protein